jgi:hypothetical protein
MKQIRSPAWMKIARLFLTVSFVFHEHQRQCAVDRSWRSGRSVDKAPTIQRTCGQIRTISSSLESPWSPDSETVCLHSEDKQECHVFSRKAFFAFDDNGEVAEKVHLSPPLLLLMINNNFLCSSQEDMVCFCAQPVIEQSIAPCLIKKFSPKLNNGMKWKEPSIDNSLA